MIPSRIFVYPVKSLAGTELRDVHIDEFGRLNGRRWMVVDQARCALFRGTGFGMAHRPAWPALPGRAAQLPRCPKPQIAKTNPAEER
jgi:hypothetical protein